MYSLGLGQDLIRCLEPTVISNVIYVVPSELEYVKDSNSICIHFQPFSNKAEWYVVQLYRHAKESKLASEEPTFLIKRKIKIDMKAQGTEIKTSFPLREYRSKLKSGDRISAWIRSTEMKKTQNIAFIGSPMQQVNILDPPELNKVSFTYHQFDTSVHEITISWSIVEGSRGYQYGFVLPGGTSSPLVKDTTQTKAILNLSHLISNLFDGLASQGTRTCPYLRLYVTALGEPGLLKVGELSVFTTELQCIITSLEGAASAKLCSLLINCNNCGLLSYCLVDMPIHVLTVVALL